MLAYNLPIYSETREEIFKHLGGEKMENKKYSVKDDFSMLAILIIPVAVAVNFVGGQLASILKLPMYLDTIGTIFAAMLCGPWVGATAGG